MKHLHLLIIVLASTFHGLIAQNTTLVVDIWGGPYKMTISGLPNTGCGDPLAKYPVHCLLSPCFRTTDPTASYSGTINGTNPLNMGLAEAGRTYPIRVQITDDGVFDNISVEVVHYSQVKEPTSIYSSLGTANDVVLATGAINLDATFNFTPTRGSNGDVLTIYFDDEGGDRQYFVTIPLLVEGLVEPNVEIIDTTVSPQVPYMILHDPPGDGSFSKLQTGKSFCRSTNTTLTNTNSFDTNLGVKVGIAGSAGIFVTTDFEFSTTVRTGFNITTSQTSEFGYETCISTTEEILTSALAPDAEDGDDLFIGYGTDMVYGVFERYFWENCSLQFDKGLTFAPIGEPVEFAMTERKIYEAIDSLRAIVDDSGYTDKARTNAQNQIDVWSQSIGLNRQNKQNASTVLKQIRNLEGGTTITVEEEQVTTTSRSILMEHAIDVTAGIEFIMEFGGSGVNGGFEFQTSSNFGQSTDQSSDNRKLVAYTLFDDDTDNEFNLDVLRDDVFGTPIFRLLSNSETSCPYEGGYQLDQPRLLNAATCSETVKDINITNAPIGQTVFVPLDICNDSKVARTYAVRLDGSTNSLGAVFVLNGKNLNNELEGQIFTIPANSCITGTLEVLPNPNRPDVRQYEHIRLVMRPSSVNLNFDCDDSASEDDILISVHFGNGTTDYCGSSDDDGDGIVNVEDNCRNSPVGGLDLDGINDFVEIPNSPSLVPTTSQTITFEAWVHPTSNEQGMIASIYEHLDVNASNFYINRAVDGMITVTGNGTDVLTSNSSIPLHAWTHIAVVFREGNGANLTKIYINGTLDQIGDINYNPSNGGESLRLGYLQGNGLEIYFKGGLDEVRIWQDERTRNEIIMYQNVELSGTENGLVAYFPFNEGEPEADNTMLDFVEDKTALMNDGQLFNFELTNDTSNWVVGAPVNQLDANDDGIGDACANEGIGICDGDVIIIDVNPLDATTTRASATITTSGEVLVAENNEVNFTAEQTITLTTGFHAQGTFTAKIEPCTADSSTEEEIENRTDEEYEMETLPIALEMNVFPNPTNGLTTIQYDLPETGEVQLSIYDMQGRIIRTLSQNLQQQAGQHQLEWNASDVPSGLYLVRIQTANDFKMQKLMVAKSWQ